MLSMEVHVKNIILCLLLVAISQNSYGENKKIIKKEARKNDTVVQMSGYEDSFILIAKKKGHIIYTGSFYRGAHIFPEGQHMSFDSSGNLKKIIRYENMDKSFEGIPCILQTEFSYVQKIKISTIKSVQSCPEAQDSPVGVWHYFRNGKLIKKIVVHDKTKLTNLPKKDYINYLVILGELKSA